MKILTLSIILSTFPLFAANNIFDKMDDKIAVSTGISKLSSDEKEALAKWLEGSQEKTRNEIKDEIRDEVIAQVKEDVREEVKEEVTSNVIKTQKKKFMGFIPNAADRENINSSVIGSFNGWRGKNIFKLENGQVWKQVEKTTFYIPKRNNPNITIKPKSMGTWALYVDGFGRGVRVKRIK